MKNVTVRYNGIPVLDGLDWTVRRGENWAVVGPNGSGKTTLLHLISADLPQAYANDIMLFGRRRGSGESIWEIKRRIGMVGAEMQFAYGKPITALETVLSGFFDSVGLYRTADRNQVSAAKRWMDDLGIGHLQDRRQDRLSCGEQRLVLVTRAVVKSPELLLLDEPCQGLDAANRRRVLSLIDTIGSRTPTQIITVTHHRDETLPCIHRELRLSRLSGPHPAECPGRRPTEF
jgi:molybdate transport system ATP-binding protein